MSKKVLITGVLGQDGANMAEYLLFKVKKSFKIYGLMRRSANPNFINTEKFKDHEDFEFIKPKVVDFDEYETVSSR